MECLQLCQVVVLHAMFLKWILHRQKPTEMVTHAARLANFEVHALWRKLCFQMSWEKLTSHSVMPCWLGRMLTCENSFDSKPQSKLFLSLFDKCHFTCLPCSRTFWKTTSKWFCKEKRNVRNISKNRSKLRWFLWKISAVLLSWSRRHVLQLSSIRFWKEI